MALIGQQAFGAVSRVMLGTMLFLVGIAVRTSALREVLVPRRSGPFVAFVATILTCAVVLPATVYGLMQALSAQIEAPVY